MPIENERKFVLADDGTLERRLATWPGVRRSFLRQAYLDASGVRIRAIDDAAGRRHFIFTYKRPVDDQMVEIETEITSADFERLWKLRRETLLKARYSWNEGRYHWDVDFFKADDRTYFALAEVEMPENDTVPPQPPPLLAAHVLMLAPRNDPRFTSKRLADRSHAERLMADVRAKGVAA